MSNKQTKKKIDQTIIKILTCDIKKNELVKILFFVFVQTIFFFSNNTLLILHHNFCYCLCHFCCSVFN